MSELIVDEPTARALLWPENDDDKTTLEPQPMDHGGSE